MKKNSGFKNLFNIVVTVLIGIMISQSNLALASGKKDIHRINNQIAKAISGVQNQNTIAKLYIKDLDINDIGVKKLVFQSMVKKYSPKTNETVKLTIKGAYSNPYQEGVDPETTIDFNGKFNFLKVVSENDYNELVQDLESLGANLFEGMKEQYKDAIVTNLTVQKKPFENTKANEIEVIGGYQLDINKLPSDMPANDIEFVGISFRIKVTPMSFEASVTLKSNKKYVGFEKDGLGLKEVVEGLLNNDPKIIKEITDIVEFLNEMGNSLIERIESGTKPESNY